jgi:hypothetical protein
MRLLPSYIFFFSFAAFSVMLFQTILARPADQLGRLDLREQRGLALVTVIVSLLCVVSELTLIPWLKVPAGILLAVAVASHAIRVWEGRTLPAIWRNVAWRFFVTDMLFLLVAAIGLAALGWKETWPQFPLIPAFLRPSTVFLGASFPLTLTFTGYLYLFADQNGGLSSIEHRMMDGWYYVLVGGVLLFLVVILLDLRGMMQTLAIVLLAGVWAVTYLFARRLLRSPGAVHLLYGTIGLVGLLATSAAGNALIASRTPTIPAGANPILLSHVHFAQLGWVCISFWGIQYTLWTTLLAWDRRQPGWLPLGADYPLPARITAYLQLVLAVGGVALLSASHLLDDLALMRVSGLMYAVATLLPLVILRQLESATRPA